MATSESKAGRYFLMGFAFVMGGAYAYFLSWPRALIALALTLVALPLLAFAYFFLKYLLRPSWRSLRRAFSPLAGWRLRARFGPENVVKALNLRLSPVEGLIDDPLKFGGVPTFRGHERWPRCGVCAEPMTFVGQLPVGTEGDAVLSNPIPGTLYLFLCNAKPGPGAVPCYKLGREAGGSAAFVQPGWEGVAPLGDGVAERERLARVVAVNRTRSESQVLVEELRRKGQREYAPYLARQYAVEWEFLPSVRMPAHPSDEEVALVVQVTDQFHIQVGGFPEWVHSKPISFPCTCGAPTDVQLSFVPFDPVFDLGKQYGGRAYVLACRERHGPEAYFLDWQAQ